MFNELINDRVCVGIDIGAVNVRGVLIGDAGNIISVGRVSTSRGPQKAVGEIFDWAREQVSFDSIEAVGVTGSGRHLYDRQKGFSLFTSPYAAIAGVILDQPDVRTIISIGGQSSLVIGLEDGLNKPWRVARSPLCAAGTGRFLEQQASRLGISIEDFGRYALEWTEQPPRVAARCSVFAKSDLIHLQQKGWPISAMLAGLSDSVARMIQAQWRDNLESPIYCIGGVAANEGVIRALTTVFGGQPVNVPPEYASREAIGAALLAKVNPDRPDNFYPENIGDAQAFYVSRRLKQVTSSNGWKPPELVKDGIAEACLGVDVGSTSTKAAVITPDGTVLAKTYLMTTGQPLEAVKKVMANLAELVEGRVHINAVGVTGSGRYLIGSFIGADLIKNEITSQTRAALQLDPNIDTVIELGGQDSKFVYLENGTTLDYQMNKACAAGTGSFIDELAEQLGVSTRDGAFARLALSATEQLDLGEKCTAFMSQAVTSAQLAGVGIEVIVSSLSTSLVKNYLSKVVGSRRIGDRVFLAGAVFYNEAVVSAFAEELPNKVFIVPEHKEVTGAIGAALLAMEAMPEGAASKFKGFSRLANEVYKLTSFNCRKCENTCAISMMVTEAGKLFYGSRCDLFDSEAGQGKGRTVTPFTTRGRLLFGEEEGQHA